MAMRLKIEIDSAATGMRTSLLKGEDLCVLQAIKCVEGFANELPTGVCNDRTDASAGRGKSAAAARKLYCATHEVLVLFRKCHDLHDGRFAKLVRRE
jgi:hypothetical protein